MMPGGSMKIPKGSKVTPQGSLMVPGGGMVSSGTTPPNTCFALKGVSPSNLTPNTTTQLLAASHCRPVAPCTNGPFYFAPSGQPSGQSLMTQADTSTCPRTGPSQQIHAESASRPCVSGGISSDGSPHPPSSRTRISATTRQRLVACFDAVEGPYPSLKQKLPLSVVVCFAVEHW